MSHPSLIVIGGLPGTGKTTIARLLCRRLHAVHVRIDAIEQAMRYSRIEQVGTAGYSVGNALAHANLLLGLSVVADCVNPVVESRQAWANTATATAAALVQVHLVCSDVVEHRRRIEARTADLDGHTLPDWTAVLGREFQPWSGKVLRLDTADLTPAAAAERIIAYLTL